MSFSEKIDVLDLIIFCLTEHEARLDELVENLGKIDELVERLEKMCSRCPAIN